MNFVRGSWDSTILVIYVNVAGQDMIDALSFTITVATLATAALLTGRLVTGRFVRVRVTPALGLLQAALALQAVLDVIGLLGGHRWALSRCGSYSAAVQP